MDKKLFSIGASTYKLSTNETQDYINDISKKIVENYNEYSNISKFTETEKYIFACFNLADKFMKKETELSSLHTEYSNDIIDLKVKVEELEKENSDLKLSLKDREDKIALLVSELDEVTKANEEMEGKYTSIIEEKNQLISSNNNEREKLITQYKEEKDTLIKGFANEKDKFLSDKQKLAKAHMEEIAKLEKKFAQEYKEKMSASQSRYDKEINEIKQIEAKRANDKIHENTVKHERAMKDIKENIEAQSQQSIDKAVNERREELESRLANEINSLDQKHEEEVEKLRNYYEDKLAHMQSSHSDEIKELVGNKDDEVAQARAEYEGLVDEKEVYLEDLLKANNDNKNLESIINELNQRLNRLDVEVKERNGMISKLKTENEELMNILDEATN